MQLVVTDTLAKEIIRLSKSDSRLLQALAGEWVGRVDPGALAGYLLGGGVAQRLLAERLKADPEATLRDLQRLALGKQVASQGRAARPAGGAATTGTRTRQRLSPQMLAQLKAAVLDFLGGNPWATRSQISQAAKIPTPSLYNRVMSELRQARRVVAAGERAKRRYALSGSKPAAGETQGAKAPGKGKAAKARGKGKAAKAPGKGKAAKARGKGKAAKTRAPGKR